MSYQVNTGQILITYVTNVMQVALPPDFKKNCQLLDQIREELRNYQELPQDSYSTVSDYIHLLKILTSGFDLSERPSFSLNFQWGVLTKNEIDFEICCLCYNLCIGLLNSCTKLIPSDFTLKQLVQQIKAAKSLIDECREHHKDQYRKTISSNDLIDIDIYIAAVFYQIQHGVFIATKKTKILPKSSYFVSQQFKKAKIQPEDYAKYYDAVTSVYYAL